MTARHRLAAPVAIVYGLMLVVGLTLYSITRSDDPAAIAPLWVGSLLGTALGVFLALRDFRAWVAILVVVGIPCWCAPFAPPPLADENVWLAFIPAALCAFWSLGDRAALAAFWYPTVLWMLTVLDRTHGTAIPDGTGAALLGILALMLFLFLRVRETRRVGLWQIVGAPPLAEPKPVAVQKEPPGRQLARATWTLVVSALTFAVTAWVAPKLWHTETFAGDPQPIADLPIEDGLPCCPVAWEPQTRTRVKEYFDIGRGHDEPGRAPRPGVECQVCPTEGGAIEAQFPNSYYGSGVPCTYADAQAGLCMYGGPSGGDTSGGTGFVPSGRRPTIASADPAPTTADPVPGPVNTPAAVPDQAGPPETAPAPTPPSPPVVEPTPTPTPAPALSDPPPQDFTQPPPPQTTPPPAPAPDVASPPPPPPLRDTPPKVTAHAHRPPPATSAPAIMPWIVALVAGAMVFQLLTLVLRPLRRAIALRHLRRPFWDETVDQRVSNYWQLALIGLRDAGWRTSSIEPPGDFAKRAEVAGLASCATILDRARHGIAIDADDLGTMSAAAETVYRDARSQLRPGARALAWLRWPLA